MASVPRTRQRYGGTNITPGGGQQPATGGQRMSKGKASKLGHEKYLWLLVTLEVLAMIGLRHAFRRHHGG